MKTTVSGCPQYLVERLRLIRHCGNIGSWHPFGTFRTFIINCNKHLSKVSLHGFKNNNV